ncbi:MAG: 3-dehydroquinate synthase [Phycisphaerales bacterium JB037]
MPRFEEPFSVSFTHRLTVTRGVFDPANPTLARALAEASQDAAAEPGRSLPTLAFLDQGLVDADPTIVPRVASYAQSHGLALAGIEAVPGGEIAKNDPEILRRVLRSIRDAGLCRQSTVLAVGGGAVLDVVGFAAAIAHRGVKLVRVPTTTLSQDDSGVGVKNGVNALGSKNYLGAFAVPSAVINDADLLRTLSPRDWASGFSEAVKVALVKDREFFGEIRAATDAIAARDLDACEPIITRSARIHLEHITRGGDAFELTRARPLDHGHWAAHKLEQMTGYRLRHGEAVSIGIAIDARYAARTGVLSERDAATIIATLESLGLPTGDEALGDADAVLEGLEEFREHLGGALTLSLIAEPGRAVEVREVDRLEMRRAIGEMRSAGRPIAPADCGVDGVSA